MTHEKEGKKIEELKLKLNIDIIETNFRFIGNY